MLPKRKAKVAFGIAFGLVLLNGVAAVLAALRYSRSADLIAHTFEVESSTRRVESNTIDAARARYSYVQTGDEKYLQEYQFAITEVAAGIAHVRELTRDNPAQQKLFTQFEALMAERTAILDASIDLKQSGQDDANKQAEFTTQGLVSAYGMANVVDHITANEQQLLPPRVRGSQQLFIVVMLVQGAMFAIPIALFSFQYFLLKNALDERELAEGSARHLSARVLHLQDEERRRFARELHDGLGQNLCVAKIAASKASGKNPQDPELLEISRIIDQSLNETRTISYLLHPPLLDETGFISAAKWYVEGFAERSGIRVSITIPEEVDRLPREMELALFRILQESLINIHRHAKSSQADVSFELSGAAVILRIRDYGRGMPADRLQRVQSDGLQLGLGLAGMRERVREHGGRFEIHSDGSGTRISVSMPRPTGIHADRSVLHPVVQS